MCLVWATAAWGMAQRRSRTFLDADGRRGAGRFATMRTNRHGS
ncbi:hypothetical protein [Methylacidimicrobium tartarophylax]|nr:hypothetical protein [Methylacidimicrobium tartarophylax]